MRDARNAAEHDLILRVGNECQWNRSRMARALRTDRKSLYRRERKYGLLAAHPSPIGVASGTAARAKAAKATKKSQRTRTKR